MVVYASVWGFSGLCARTRHAANEYIFHAINQIHSNCLYEIISQYCCVCPDHKGTAYTYYQSAYCVFVFVYDSEERVTLEHCYIVLSIYLQTVNTGQRDPYITNHIIHKERNFGKDQVITYHPFF